MLFYVILLFRRLVPLAELSICVRDFNIKVNCIFDI